MNQKAEECWIACDQCRKIVERFKDSLRKRAGGKFARFPGHHGVWIVSPQDSGKARVTFVYDKKTVPDFTKS